MSLSIDVFGLLSPTKSLVFRFCLWALLVDAACGGLGRWLWVGETGGNNSGGFGEHDLAEIRCQSIKERIGK